MTDDREHTQLEARLAAWFQGEVSKAERDLVGRSAHRMETPTRRRAPVLIAGVVVLASLIGTAAILGSRPPSIAVVDEGSPPATSSSSMAPSTSAPSHQIVGSEGVTAWFRDGVPSAVEGEPVLRPSETAVRLASGTFTGLVGGWVRTTPIASCPAPGPCQQSMVLGESIQSDAVVSVARPQDLPSDVLVAVVRIVEPAGPATLVATVDPSFLEDRAADGIPTVLDGEVVHRAGDLAGLASAASDDTPFLVGGWIRPGGGRGCPITLEGRPTPHPLALGAGCGGAYLSEGPWGSVGGHLIAPSPVAAGPVVVRVHTRDPRAATCRYVTICEAAVVQDEIVWSGDSWTAGSPLGIDDVVVRLQAGLFHDVVVEALPSARASGIRGDQGTACDYGVPPQAWQTSQGLKLGRIFVYASIAERVRFQPYFGDSGLSSLDADGSRCSVVVDKAFASHWVAVDNVLVEVYVGFQPDKADAARIMVVEAALRAE